MMPIIEVLEECKCANGDAFRLRNETWVGSSHIKKSPERLTGEHRRPGSTMSAPSTTERAGDDPRVKEIRILTIAYSPFRLLL